MSIFKAVSSKKISITVFLVALLVISTITYPFIATSKASEKKSPTTDTGFIFGTPTPANGSKGNPLDLNWSIAINDTNGYTFDWTIQCNNTNNASGTDENNGTKMAHLSLLSPSTTYTVYVNATEYDGKSWYGQRYQFTTNQPPNTPSNPSPANASTNIPILPTVSWTGGDPDNDTVLYDLYFGTTHTPPKYASNLANTTYTFTTPLAYSKTYYWYIKATDNHTTSTTGPLWQFTTTTKPSGVHVTITSPLNNSLYCQGQHHNLTGRTFIYGPINITADATADAGITNVLFLIDGKLKANITTAPYYYNWKPLLQFKGLSLKHNITVQAYDAIGQNATASIIVTKWRFHALPWLILGASIISGAIPHTTMKGIVFHLKPTAQGYTFLAIHMRYHTTNLLQNSHGVIWMKKINAPIVSGPLFILPLAPAHLLAYIRITFLGSLQRAEAKPPNLNPKLSPLLTHNGCH